jgi:hypothetical protein
VVPPNPLLMSAQERAQTAATFQRLAAPLNAASRCRSTSTRVPSTSASRCPRVGERSRRARGRTQPANMHPFAARRARRCRFLLRCFFHVNLKRLDGVLQWMVLVGVGRAGGREIAGAMGSAGRCSSRQMRRRTLQRVSSAHGEPLTAA